MMPKHQRIKKKLYKYIRETNTWYVTLSTLARPPGLSRLSSLSSYVGSPRMAHIIQSP
jgi:hypothetical protein